MFLNEPRKSDYSSIKKFKVKTDVSESLPVGLAVLLERINRIKGRVTIIN